MYVSKTSFINPKKESEYKIAANLLTFVTIVYCNFVIYMDNINAFIFLFYLYSLKDK